MVIIFTTIVGCLLLVLIGWMGIQTGKTHSDEVLGQLKAESRQSEKSRLALIELNTQATSRILELESQLRKTVSQKKSSEVRTGLIAEQSLAFLQGLPYNFSGMRFIGAPVDYVYFDTSDPDSPFLTIVEVKSGAARESKTQRLVRKAILSGNVSYDVVRVGTDGVTIKKYKKCPE